MTQLEKLSTIEHVLIRIIKCERYFDLCTGHRGAFWPIVQNSLGESTCLFWCHLFGNRSDDVHFTQFFIDEVDNEFSVPKVKARLLDAMGLTEDSYKDFWESVKTCRDKFISHKELGVKVVFPQVNLCRIQAEELRRILAEYSDIKSPDNSEWANWSSYYRAQELESAQFENQCHEDFNQGILEISGALNRRIN